MTTTIRIYKYHSQKAKDIKLQTVKDLRATSHEEYDKWGKLRKNHYVEFVVVGKNRQWQDFMTVKDFKKLNPGVSI